MSVVDENGNAITDPNHIGNLNPFRYRGYYYDAETGLYYLMSRYYDPQVKRFINADGMVSTGQGLLGYNMFAYANNNPVMCPIPRATNGQGKGWESKDGGVWVWTPGMDGGDVDSPYPSGNHWHAYPNGNKRVHKEAWDPAAFSSNMAAWNPAVDLAIGGYAIYTIAKWGLAGALAPVTGGSSFGLAAAMP